jgi:hypothetical protein
MRLLIVVSVASAVVAAQAPECSALDALDAAHRANDEWAHCAPTRCIMRTPVCIPGTDPTIAWRQETHMKCRL